MILLTLRVSPEESSGPRRSDPVLSQALYRTVSGLGDFGRNRNGGVGADQFRQHAAGTEPGPEPKQLTPGRFRVWLPNPDHQGAGAFLIFFSH
jgi:hypothetical protein